MKTFFAVFLAILAAAAVLFLFFKHAQSNKAKEELVSELYAKPVERKYGESDEERLGELNLQVEIQVTAARALTILIPKEMLPSSKDRQILADAEDILDQDAMRWENWKKALLDEISSESKDDPKLVDETRNILLEKLQARDNPTADDLQLIEQLKADLIK